MKHLTLAATMAFVASPALAHGGAHLHPHGIEFAVAGLAAATLTLVAFIWRR